MKKLTSNIRLESVAPFDTSMDALNKGYYICGGVCAAVGIIAGPLGIAIGGIIGLFLWWVIKANIAQMSLKKLKKYTFVMDREISYNELIASMAMALMPYRIDVIKQNDGSPEMTYRGVRLRVKYNNDGTFSIPWKINIGLLFDPRYITRYKNTIAGMSIIGYAAQQACSNNSETATQINVSTNTRSCTNCGTGISDEAKFCPGCGEAAPDEVIVKYCSNCGNKYAEGALFCGGCGSPLN